MPKMEACSGRTCGRNFRSHSHMIVVKRFRPVYGMVFRPRILVGECVDWLLLASSRRSYYFLRSAADSQF